MSKILAITSGKGGTGKSTVSVALSIAFSKLNKNVLVIDLDEGLRCLDMVFGIDKEVVFDLSDIFSGRDIEDAVYKVENFPEISFIPAPNKPVGIQPEKLKELIDAIDEKFDIIILDMPAGIDFSPFESISDRIGFITVCNADPVSVRDASVVYTSLPQTSIEPRLIINRFFIPDITIGKYKNIDDIIDTGCMRLLGIVPQDYELAMLPITHTIRSKSRAFKAFKRIACRILGEDIPLPKPKKI